MSLISVFPEIHRLFGVEEMPIDVSCAASLSPWAKVPGQLLQEQLPPAQADWPPLNLFARV